jgi:hypothetical protein
MTKHDPCELLIRMDEWRDDAERRVVALEVAIQRMASGMQTLKTVAYIIFALQVVTNDNSFIKETFGLFTRLLSHG